MSVRKVTAPVQKWFYLYTNEGDENIKNLLGGTWSVKYKRWRIPMTMNKYTSLYLRSLVFSEQSDDDISVDDPEDALDDALDDAVDAFVNTFINDNTPETAESMNNTTVDDNVSTYTITIENKQSSEPSSEPSTESFTEPITMDCSKLMRRKITRRKKIHRENSFNELANSSDEE